MPKKMQSLMTPSSRMLYGENYVNLTHKLTPRQLKNILDRADQGDILEQHILFSDMEDSCEHLAAEISKRKRALLTLDWEILPSIAKNKEAKQIATAMQGIFERLTGLEDLFMDMADAIGHGFSSIELEWAYLNGLHLPLKFHFRPQSWWQMPYDNRNELFLRDGTPEGALPQAFGWIIHKHRSRSGWLPRVGVFKSIAWAYMIRSYALESSINYVQVHGLPWRLGKYPPGSSEDDKSALFQALRTLGRDAAGIIPSGMEILFEVPPASTTDLAGELVRRCEMGMSKAILGGTLTSQADGKTSTNALGQVHEEVRLDLLVSDAVQISNTLTQQLIKPLAYLNLGIKDASLLPYFALILLRLKIWACMLKLCCLN